MEQAFSRHEHPGRCDVCGKEGLVVTNRSSFGPFDFHYCEECFRMGAEPYWFAVSTVALFGLWPNDVNEAFQAKIRSILKYLDRSEDTFRRDVYKAYHDMPIQTQ